MFPKKIIYFLPAILYYLFIFVLSSLSPPIKYKFPHLDKFFHFFEFLGLSLLLCLGFFKSLKSSSWIKSTLTLLSSIFLGFLDEFHQLFVPQRSFDFLDMVADFLGIMAGIFLYLSLSSPPKSKSLKEF